MREQRMEQRKGEFIKGALQTRVAEKECDAKERVAGRRMETQTTVRRERKREGANKAVECAKCPTLI